MANLIPPSPYLSLALLVAALASVPAAAQPAQPSPTAAAPASLEFSFDAGLAKLAAQAVATGGFDDATLAAIRAHPASAAMVRKMRLKDVDDLIAYFRKLAGNASSRDAARQVSAELASPDGGKLGPLSTTVTRQLRAYVPSQFAARLKVWFLFGGNAGGFAFDDVQDDVYVNLANYTQATTEELAEIVSHELLHAVQGHVMATPPRPASGMPVAATGPVWMKRLVYDLLQEGTAELFTHGVAERAATAHSSRDKARIERNSKRIRGIMTLFETTGWRLRLAPPPDENAYDRIYGALFYADFDETAYDLGWLMASTIEKQEGKGAIFELFKNDPVQFVLRYQAIAEKEASLPKFSDEFIEALRALR
jgi:Putative zinc dependent peptidase (DUF5700)